MKRLNWSQVDKSNSTDWSYLREYYGAKETAADRKAIKNDYIQKKLWDERIKCMERNIDSCSRFLDIGCAGGLYSGVVREAFGRRTQYVGLDISSIYLNRAKLTQVGEFVLGNVQSLPLCNGSFDVVLMSEVIEHLPDPYLGFSEALRASSKFLIITTPKRSFFRRIIDRLGFQKDSFNHGVGHIFEISFKDILEWTQNNGAKLIDIKWDCYLPSEFINFLHLPFSLVRLIDSVLSRIPYFNKEFPIMQLYVIKK